MDNADGLEEDICIQLTHGGEQARRMCLVLVTSRNLRFTLWEGQKIFVDQLLGPSVVRNAWDMRLWGSQPVTRLPAAGVGSLRVVNFIPCAILDVNAAYGVKRVGGLPGSKIPIRRGTLNIETEKEKNDLECMAIPHYKGGHPEISCTEKWPLNISCSRDKLRSVKKVSDGLIDLCRYQGLVRAIHQSRLRR